MTARASAAAGISRIVLALSFGLLLLAPFALQAQGRDRAIEALYSVTGVPVDATAQSAVVAREAARMQGEITAFQLLVERLVPLAERARVPMPQGEALTNMINSFEVEDERTSAVRYLGRYTFRFDPVSVRALLMAAGVQAITEPGPRTVILPVLDASSGAVLWSGLNPWLELWQRQPPPSPLVLLELPLGDLDDLTAADAPAALLGIQPEGLQSLMARYDSSRVVTVALRPEAEEVTADGPLSLRVIQHEAGLPPMEVLSAVPPAGSVEDRLVLAGQAAVVAIQGLPGSGMPPAMTAPAAEVLVSVPLSSLQEWVGLRQKLQMAGIRAVSVRSLSVTQAKINLGYDLAQALVVGLDQQGLVLVHEDGFPIHPAMAGEAHLRMGPLTLRLR